ncbi:MAG: SprT family zinc-dependent metalloprotease [bacterium]|nr:SprT family zinc-dependent metalloprotease [bacterium]
MEASSTVTLAEKEYNVIIKRKNNKNIYMRIDDNLNIVVSAPFFTREKEIFKIILKEEAKILKMIAKKDQKEDKNSLLLFGKEYKVIYGNLFDTPEIRNDTIFVRDEKLLNKFVYDNLYKTFENRLYFCYNLFTDNIPYPTLAIRNMKTRWGVCNTRLKKITLNFQLYHYDIQVIDYVIIHELSHFLVQNHSQNFWKVVSTYCPDYKALRKKLKQ